MVMIMKENKFRGHWITTGDFCDLSPRNVFHRQLDKASRPAFDENLNNRHILFRRKFTLERTEQTLIRITADDYYKLYINGVFVTQGPTPGYNFHYFYNEIDISGFVQAGVNTIAVHTYYQGLINRVWVSGDRRHGLFLELSSGGETILGSDESFLCQEHSGFSAAGTVGYATQFMERYDAASPEVGFEQPDFDDFAWAPAKIRRHADYQLYLQPSKMLEFEKITPSSVKKSSSQYLVDFGGMFVGSLEFGASGPAGSEIVMRFGQELNADGTVRYQLRANCNYVEYFKLSGRHDILNQFDYKSFRYVELLLPSGCKVDESSLVMHIRHYPFELKAKCKYDDGKSLAVWNLCVDSLRYGVQEVIQDCMEREKGYYLGDGCYSMLAWTLLNDDYSLLEKFFDDFLRTSFINRGLMTCSACSFMQEIAEYPLIMFTSLLEYCCLTGNYDFVRARFDAFVDILNFYREQYAESNGLLNHLDKWCVVEWPANMRDGYDVDIAEGKPCDTMHNAINAYYIGAIKCLNKVAAMIGRDPYTDVTALEGAFIKAFYNPERKLFKDSVDSEHISMAANILPWFFEIVPEPEFVSNTIAMIREKRLSQSLFFLTFPMFIALVREGEEALVHDLLRDDRYWLNIIAEGGTRTFEGWSKDLKWNTSLFHLTLSYAVVFMVDWDIRNIFSFSPGK